VNTLRPGDALGLPFARFPDTLTDRLLHTALWSQFQLTGHSVCLLFRERRTEQDREMFGPRTAMRIPRKSGRWWANPLGQGDCGLVMCSCPPPNSGTLLSHKQPSDPVASRALLVTRRAGTCASRAFLPIRLILRADDDGPTCFRVRRLVAELIDAQRAVDWRAASPRSFCARAPNQRLN